MNSEPEILARLQKVFDKIFLEPVSITPQLSAPDVEGWDSLTQILLVVEVEKAFGVKFQVGEVEGLQNVGEFVSLISKYLQRKQQAA